MIELKWKQIDDDEFVTFIKGDMKIQMNIPLVLIAPLEDSDDYFEKCDMMMSNIFILTLFEIISGGKHGRRLIHDHVSKDEAIWFLGQFNISLSDKAEIYKSVEEKDDEQKETTCVQGI